jgi:hypothetical protein
MAPLRRLPEGLTEAKVAAMAALVARIRQHEQSIEQDRRTLHRMVAAAHAAGASLGALAEVTGLARSGVQGMVRRGLREETR